MAEGRASIAKHPLHPMLVVFPIGLWVAALAFDIVETVTGNPLWRMLADHHHSRVVRPLAEHRLGPALVEITATAG